MNKVMHINLGGTPFAIDEDAYERLSIYLDSLHRHFRYTEGYEEITSDIEARMAELFRNSLGGRQIVSIIDVDEAIAVMGTPEDFGAGVAGEDPLQEGAESTGSGYRTGKRLFRNPEDKVVSGVSSGIAAYFGISDPVWVRLLFVLVTFSGGFGIPIYLILWAIMPPARTASDRLAMRGEPINIQSISRIIREEFGHLQDKMEQMGEEFKKK